jgi:branched-chain amino acid transport system permease protein
VVLDIVIVNILNGVSYAFILFLIASGLSLIFGVLGILNLAHGALYLLGAFVGLTVASHLHNFWLAALLGALGVGVIGLMLERLFLGRLYKQLNEQALLTLGLVYIFANAVLWIWGPSAQMGNPPAILSGSINISGFTFPVYRLGIILIGIVLFTILWWSLDKTRIGAKVRAGMEDKEMTIGLGINYGFISTAVFSVGATMGGLAGFLGTPIVGVFPEMSMPILLLAMIVVVIGGLGTVQGALLGSLIIGLIDTFGKAYFPDFAMFTIYLIFIIALLIRPTGLLGRKLV